MQSSIESCDHFMVFKTLRSAVKPRYHLQLDALLRPAASRPPLISLAPII